MFTPQFLIIFSYLEIRPTVSPHPTVTLHSPIPIHGGVESSAPIDQMLHAHALENRRETGQVCRWREIDKELAAKILAYQLQSKRYISSDIFTVYIFAHPFRRPLPWPDRPSAASASIPWRGSRAAAGGRGDWDERASDDPPCLQADQLKHF